MSEAAGEPAAEPGAAAEVGPPPEAETGITTGFTIEARDAFSNLRAGESTTHVAGYGDGMSDYFLVTFTGPFHVKMYIVLAPGGILLYKM